jgi:hypothetical protein
MDYRVGLHTHVRVSLLRLSIGEYSENERYSLTMALLLMWRYGSATVPRLSYYVLLRRKYSEKPGHVPPAAGPASARYANALQYCYCLV